MTQISEMKCLLRKGDNVNIESEGSIERGFSSKSWSTISDIGRYSYVKNLNISYMRKFFFDVPEDRNLFTSKSVFIKKSLILF